MSAADSVLAGQSELRSADKRRRFSGGSGHSVSFSCVAAGCKRPAIEASGPGLVSDSTPSIFIVSYVKICCKPRR